MSRHAAATTAGRARTLQRSPAPAAPRRVSGPATPNRRDAEGPREGTSRGGTRAPRSAGGETARTARAATVSRAPRPGIAVTALAYADAALAPRVRASQAPRTFAAPRPQRLAYGGVAIAQRMAGVAVDVSASRAMDRLVRSRVWIGIVAFGLIGLVAMQVSLLKLNSGIGRAVETASTLERSNQTLRAEISTLSSGERIQKLAADQNMIMPAPSDVTYLRAGNAHGDAVRAAQHMRAPDPALPAGLAGAAVQSIAPATVTPAAATSTTPVTPATDATTQAPPTTGTTANAAPPAAASTATGTTANAAPPAAATTATGTTATATPPAEQPAAAGATAAPTTGAASGGASPATTATP